MLDAPISGSTVTLAEGKASIMVGGDRHAFERVQPVLLAIGPKVTYIGGNGAGGAAEACDQPGADGRGHRVWRGRCVGREGGCGAEVAVDAMLKSVVASPVLGYRGPFILEGKMPAVPLADVMLQQKDMTLVLELDVKWACRYRWLRPQTK